MSLQLERLETTITTSCRMYLHVAAGMSSVFPRIGAALGSAWRAYKYIFLINCFRIFSVSVKIMARGERFAVELDIFSIESELMILASRSDT
jgi:hypothetical protein